MSIDETSSGLSTKEYVKALHELNEKYEFIEGGIYSLFLATHGHLSEKSRDSIREHDYNHINRVVRIDRVLEREVERIGLDDQHALVGAFRLSTSELEGSDSDHAGTVKAVLHDGPTGYMVAKSLDDYNEICGRVLPKYIASYAEELTALNERFGLHELNRGLNEDQSTSKPKSKGKSY